MILAMTIFPIFTADFNGPVDHFEIWGCSCHECIRYYNDGKSFNDVNRAWKNLEIDHDMYKMMRVIVWTSGMRTRYVSSGDSNAYGM